MTAARFRDVAALLLLSSRDLADALRCDDRLVRRWASGKVAVPPEVGAWLEALAAVWATRPEAAAAWYRRADRTDADGVERGPSQSP